MSAAAEFAVPHVDRLRGLVSGRPVIVVGDVLANTTRMVESFRDLGAERCLCVAASVGTGPGPDASFAPNPVVLEVQCESTMGSIWASLEALEGLDGAARDAVDTFDPDRTALIAAPIFYTSETFAGRAVFGGRKPSWRALEDKTTVDDLWDAVGIPRAPHELVEVSVPAARSAASRLDRGAGTVWTADNRLGFSGGAELTRWVRRDSDIEEAVEFFRDSAHQLRVMPFLEGIPCSIHGLVTPAQTLAFRPCEMLVLRPAGTIRFQYAGSATTWDPAPADREAMRALARRVGEALRQRVEYRGLFSVDGVMTVDGFRPTELNPREGAAVRQLVRGSELPLGLLNRAIVDGIAWPEADGAMERAIVEWADAHRRLRSFATGPGREVEAHEFYAELGDGGIQRVDEPTPRAWKVEAGPGPSGAFVGLTAPELLTTPGPSRAPELAALLSALDADFGWGFGPYEPARAVR